MTNTEDNQIVVKNLKQFVWVTIGWISAPVVIMIFALIYG